MIALAAPAAAAPAALAVAAPAAAAPAPETEPAESDNVRLTAPATEIVGEQRMAMLPGHPGNVGECYGRGFERALVALVEPAR